MVSIKEYVAISKATLKGIIEASAESEYEQPHLLVLEFNGDKSSESYIKGLKKDCKEIGITVTHHNVKHAEKLTTQQAVNIFEVLQELNDFDAVIIQKPIPENIDVTELSKAIRTIQDVDGFIDDSPYMPCTPKGVIDYLEYCEYEFEGKTACVVGRSKTIGKPLADMLLDRNCTVTVCHSKTKDDDLRTYMSESDIVFTCTNKIEQFNEEYLSVLSDLIDFGIGIGKDGKLHGNVHRDTVQIMKESNSDVDNHIVISGTGGTGLLTRVTLMENIVKATYGWGHGKVENNEQDSED